MRLAPGSRKRAAAVAAGSIAVIAVALWVRFLLRGRRSPEAPGPDSAVHGGGQSVEGYCARERKKVTIKEPRPEVTKGGRPAIRGSCPDCGAAIFRFGELTA